MWPTVSACLRARAWHDGKLFVSDFYTRRVLAFGPDGSFETVAEVPHQPSGLGWDQQGRMLIVSMLDRTLLRREHDGRITVVADLQEWCPAPANDMVVDSRGRAYIGNFGELAGLGATNIVRVDPDGTIAIAAKDVFCPNGACITPDQRTFLLAETFASRISAFDIADDGSLINRRTWAKFAERIETEELREAAEALPLLPDGICLDAEGCLWLPARRAMVPIACAKVETLLTRSRRAS